MDKIEKEFSKFSQHEREWVKEVLKKLQKNDLKGLNVKRLKGTEYIFRVRKGNIRIIYRSDKGKIFVLAIERRREDTYKF